MESHEVSEHGMTSRGQLSTLAPGKPALIALAFT